MRTLALIALAAALPAAGVASAQAMPLPAPAGTGGGIVEVSGGCGPGGHRDFYGRCLPNYYRPFYRPVYRVCPPGFHLGPYRGRCFPNY